MLRIACAHVHCSLLLYGDAMFSHCYDMFMNDCTQTEEAKESSKFWQRVNGKH